MDFSEVYQRYVHDVHRFSLYLSGDPALADDLTAETFVHAFWGARDLRVGTVKAYLLAIASRPRCLQSGSRGSKRKSFRQRCASLGRRSGRIQAIQQELRHQHVRHEGPVKTIRLLLVVSAALIPAFAGYTYDYPSLLHPATPGQWTANGNNVLSTNLYSSDSNTTGGSEDDYNDT